MAGQNRNETGFATFESGAALEPNRRVKLASGVLQYAGIAEYGIGVTDDRATAAGQQVAVKLWSAPGTQRVTASEAITTEAVCYTAANGKVSDSSGGGALACGTALEAATGDGSFFEMLPRSE